MNDLNELPERDRLLAQRLSATLDKAAARPDPLLDQALASTRAHLRDNSATHAQRQLRPWLWASGMALAAGLAMVAILPGAAPTPATVPHMTPVAKAAPSPVDDPEMLEDLDMLQTLSADGGQSNKS